VPTLKEQQLQRVLSTLSGAARDLLQAGNSLRMLGYSGLEVNLAGAVRTIRMVEAAVRRRINELRRMEEKRKPEATTEQPPARRYVSVRGERPVLRRFARRRGLRRIWLR